MAESSPDPARLLAPVPSRRAILSGSLAATGLILAGCAAPAPERADAPVTRVIPFALWAGAPGATFGDPVDVTVGSRTIRGPFDWRHPVTGLSARQMRDASAESRSASSIAMPRSSPANAAVSPP